MRVIYISDFDIRGSGYMNISIPLCKGLCDKGHEITALGMGYKGDEHTFPFKLIPMKDWGEVYVAIHNLKFLWKPDIVVASLDIPWHEQVLQRLMKDTIPPLPYVGIFPVESDPLCIDWAMIVMQMQAQLTISQFGANECQKQGVPAEHLQVGIDTVSWRIPTPKERQALRDSIGFTQDDVIILTVADNSERKNLGRALQSISLLRKMTNRPIRYALVTREHNNAGYRLRSLASREDIAVNDIFYLFERGMSFEKLWGMYAVADIFFLPSQAEGLGMPLLEAMACGVPCVATEGAGMKELLADGRGILIPPEVIYPFPFGNGNRYMISAQGGAEGLYAAMDEECRTRIIVKARTYVEQRPWQIAIDKLDEVIQRVYEKQK